MYFFIDEERLFTISEHLIDDKENINCKKLNKSDEDDPNMSIAIFCSAGNSRSHTRTAEGENEEIGLNDVSENDVDTEDQSLCDSFYSGKNYSQVVVYRWFNIFIWLWNRWSYSQ